MLRASNSLATCVDQIRADFPILNLKIGDKSLVYLDNAASSQMPQLVIDRLVRYQTTQHANIHRAVHHLSEVATHEYEAARRRLQHFINAREDKEVIFTSGTTDAINLVMHGYGRKFIQKGDEIILTHLEHHSNIVPWQMLAQEKGAIIRVVPINDSGELLIDEYEKLFNTNTRFVGLTHVSNALGTINPIKEMIAFAHQRGVPVLIDGAQAAAHLTVDVQALDCLGVDLPVSAQTVAQLELLDRGAAELDRWEQRLHLFNGPLAFLRRFRMMKAMDGFGVMSWYYAQLYSIGRSGAPDPGRSVFSAVREVEAKHKALLAGRHKAAA